MKILFLDIDGVLNSLRSLAAFRSYPQDFSDNDLVKFDMVAVALVRRLCHGTDCKIVLSSTWRYYFTPAQVSEALDLPVIDATTTSSYCDYANRGHEIAGWLTAHPEVTHYAIVDDIDAMLPEQQAHFVQTDEEWGLSLHDYRRLRAILTDADMAV